MARAVRSRSDKLVGDLRAVLEDAEALLVATAGQVGDKVQRVRDRAEETVKNARKRLVQAEEELADRAKAAAREADRYVHDSPWQAIGIAAGVAFILGLMAGRR